MTDVPDTVDVVVGTPGALNSDHCFVCFVLSNLCRSTKSEVLSSKASYQLGQCPQCSYELTWYSLLWPGASQWRIYYHRKWGQLSTTFSNALKQTTGELLVAVNHNQLRTMASETVDPIDWSHYMPVQMTLSCSKNQQTDLLLLPPLTGTWLGFRSGAITGQWYWILTKLRLRSLIDLGL